MADLFRETDQYSVESYGSHEEWLSSRGKGIGGSDASALCDQSRFKTLQDLWFEKVQGKKKPVGGPNVEYGKTAEPALRILYQAKHLDQDVQYMEDAVLVSKSCSWQRYSPDGLIWDPETGRRGILEIKTSQVNNGHKAQEWADGVPIEYYLQVLHGMLVTGFDFVTVTAELRFWDGRVEIIERSYARDDVQSDLEALERIERENWEMYFVKQQIPPLNVRL